MEFLFEISNCIVSCNSRVPSVVRADDGVVMGVIFTAHKKCIVSQKSRHFPMDAKVNWCDLTLLLFRSNKSCHCYNRKVGSKVTVGTSKVKLILSVNSIGEN